MYVPYANAYIFALASTGGEAKIVNGVATRVLATEHPDVIIRELAIHLNTSIPGGLAKIENTTFMFITSSTFFI